MITQDDKDLLAEIDKAIESETKLLPITIESVRSTYDRDAPYQYLNHLRSTRNRLIIGLADVRLNTINAANRLTQ
jgi:hypothetical protein